MIPMQPSVQILRKDTMRFAPANRARKNEGTPKSSVKTSDIPLTGNPAHIQFAAEGIAKKKAAPEHAVKNQQRLSLCRQPQRAVQTSTSPVQQVSVAGPVM